MGVKLDTAYRIEQFLYREARLLDECRYREWLDLLTDDVRYWVPAREIRIGTDREGASTNEELPIIDDDKMFLEARIRRLESGNAHAETPPSRTRRMITNIEPRELSSVDYEVFANICVFQCRHDRKEYVFLGRRQDNLRGFGDEFKISARKIVIDHTLMPRALSILL